MLCHHKSRRRRPLLTDTADCAVPVDDRRSPVDTNPSTTGPSTRSHALRIPTAPVVGGLVAGDRNWNARVMGMDDSVSGDSETLTELRWRSALTCDRVDPAESMGQGRADPVPATEGASHQPPPWLAAAHSNTQRLNRYRISRDSSGCTLDCGGMALLRGALRHVCPAHWTRFLRGVVT